MIRHPRTFGRLGRLRSAAVHALAAARPRAPRARPGPTTPSAASGSCSAPTSCRRCSAPTSSSSPTRSRAITPAGIRTADGSEHEVDCIIWGTGFRTNDFMFPMEITGAGGRTLRDEWAGRAARPPRHHRARLPLAVSHVRAEHEHLGRLDRLLPRGAGRLHPPGAAARPRRRRRRRSTSGPRSRRRATARRRSASPAPPGSTATPGTATRAAGSSPTGPATCASTTGDRRLDPRLRADRRGIRRGARAVGRPGRSGLRSSRRRPLDR